MWSRREFLSATALAAVSSPWLGRAESAPAGSASGPLKKLAILCTHWTFQSHAQHMGDRFLVGYPHEGRWHQPPFDVVSVYADQRPDGDLVGRRAEEFGFRIAPTVAEALTLGGDRLAVDAVLLIGEHGDYPINEIGQKQYPRYEMFKAATEVFRASKRSVPIFNDKHLSWNYDWAREMVQLSRELKFGFGAGSSLPVTWRMPAVDLPYNARVTEGLVVAFGPTDIYDFHALESLQCLLERREGGETGVAWIEAMKGPDVWSQLTPRRGGISRLFEACLSRSHMLKQARDTFGHRYPTFEELGQLCPNPVMYRFQYRDGVQGTMVLADGLVDDFNVAVQLAESDEIVSTQLNLPPRPNVAYSAPLMASAEQLFRTNQAVAPVERTLLTSGLVRFGLQSLHDGQRIDTPQLDVVYRAPQASLYAQR
jgi:hypothetical protein